MSVIQAGNTTTTSLIYTGDTTGNLVFTTGGANTVALTLANTQSAIFAANVTVTGSITATGGVVQGANAAPTFRAYQGNDQTMANGDTAYTVQLTSVTFNTASRFNNTGSTVNGIPAYAFMPNVAGYYQVNGKAFMNKSAGFVYGFVSILKNGSTASIGSYLFSVSTIDNQSMVSDVIYMNGTTDYIQLACQASAASVIIKAGSVFTYFSASLIRSA